MIETHFFGVFHRRGGRNRTETRFVLGYVILQGGNDAFSVRRGSDDAGTNLCFRRLANTFGLNRQYQSITA